KEIELDERGKVTENWIIRALSLKSWFGERLTMPPAGKSHDSITADAESVMHHYVMTQAINPADPADALPIVAGRNLRRGESLAWESRLRILAEEMAEIGLISGLGWNIEIDRENKQFVFTT